MGCACGQKSVPPTGSRAAQDAAERAKAVAEARAANSATQRIGPVRPAVASGQSQTFTQESGESFGSALERDAAAARLTRR
jgi:hypothetical protein